MILAINLFSVITTVLSMFVSFFMIILIMKEKVSKGQMYFAITISFTFAFCLCSYMEVTSGLLTAKINAVKVGYECKILLICFYLYFLAEYYHIKINRYLRWIFWMVNFFLMATVMAFPYNDWFYKNITLTYLGRMPLVHKEYGFAFVIMIIETYSILLISIIVISRSLRKSMNPIQKKRDLMMLLGILSPTIGIALEMLKIWKGYDLIALCFTITGIFCIICIRKYHMFDLEQNAKEYVLDNAGEAVVILDTKHKVVYYNQLFFEMYPKVVLNKKLEDVADDGEEKKLSKKLAVLYMTIEKGEKIHENKIDLEFAYHEQSFHLNMTPIYRKSGNIMGYLLEIQDLTEKKRMIEKIAHLTAEAENANRTKSSFLANMSHEIRTPINAILGMDEMILREGTEQIIHDYANNISVAGNNLLTLVNDILDFSKLESGHMELVETDYDVVEMAESIHMKLQSRIAGEEVKLTYQIDSELPRKLYGDQIRVEQLLVNVISSSIKFTQHEELEIKFSFHKEDFAYKGYQGIRLRISFNETGKIIRTLGYDVESFKKYSIYREGAEMRAGSHHLELSMAMIDQLLIILNGTKNMAEGQEITDVYFEVPQGVADAQPVGEVELFQKKKKDNNVVYENSDANILVVDDNAVNLKVMKGLLKRTKANVYCAKSGSECLEMIKENSFDIIFMDHLMPEMDGIETLQKLKEENQVNHIPVIALTANAFQGAREMYMEEGFSDYLMKPVDGNKLETALVTYLQKKN